LCIFRCGSGLGRDNYMIAFIYRGQARSHRRIFSQALSPLDGERVRLGTPVDVARVWRSDRSRFAAHLFAGPIHGKDRGAAPLLQ